MPSKGSSDNYKLRSEIRKAAIESVLAKFPNIIVGSSGFHRVVAAKLKQRRFI